MFALLISKETSKLIVIIKLKVIIRQKLCFCLCSQERIKHNVAVFNNAIHNIKNDDSARKSQNCTALDAAAMAKMIASTSVSNTTINTLRTSQKLGNKQLLKGLLLFTIFSVIYNR